MDGIQKVISFGESIVHFTYSDDSGNIEVIEETD